VSKGIQIAIGALLVAALLGWYASSNLEERASFVYQTLRVAAGEVSGPARAAHR
jgi:hypothetical protein